MVTLLCATSDQDPLLRDLLQSYIHELSEIFPVAREPDRRFKYEKLSLYTGARPDPGVRAYHGRIPIPSRQPHR
jgi:hypothetical protein